MGYYGIENLKRFDEDWAVIGVCRRIKIILFENSDGADSILPI